MLQIRSEQYEALSRYMLEQFEDRMVAHLRANFGEQTKDLEEPDLRSFIRDGMKRAERYQVEREDDVRRYLEAMALYGRDFDTDPRTEWAGRILRDPDLSGEQKMDRMADYEVFELEGGAVTRVAKKPLNEEACRQADEDFYNAHENDPRPNACFDEHGNRKPLSATDPKQTELRKEWMDLYICHGGKVEYRGRSKKPKDPKETCPKKEEPEYHLHVDADRDGTVDDDRSGIDTWNWGKGKKGAIILCNNDDDAGAAQSDNEDEEINSGNDKDEVAPFEIRRTGPDPPADWEGVIEVSAADKDRVRIFESRGTAATEVIGPIAGNSFTLPDLKFTKKELGIEALRYAGEGFDGEVTLIFKLKKGGAVAQTETATLRVAPWMMPNHLDKAKTVYVVDAGGSNDQFRKDLKKMVSAAGCTLKEHVSGDIWMQDCMEIGFANLAPSHGYHTVMRNPRDRDLKMFAETLRDADFGYHEQGTPGPDWTTFDSTGNLECTPPFKGYPWGRMYYGPGIGGGDKLNPTVKAFLNSQVVQKPIEIDTSWLNVGHVDEIITFVPAPGGKGFKLLLASPKLAYEILDANKKSHPAARMLRGREFPSEAPRVNQSISIRKFLRDGLPKLNSKFTSTYLRSFNTIKQAQIDSARKTFETELGLAASDIIDVPVIFADMVETGMADAVTAGMVNMLVINKHCIAPKPFGPVVNKIDLFERDLKHKLAPLGLSVHFLVDWLEYHVNLGEVHCGTNTLREPMSAKWWEFKP